MKHQKLTPQSAQDVTAKKPQTTTQRTAAHRRRGKELVERLTAALTDIAEAHPAWISDNPEWAIEIAQKAIEK
jgi:hypothetical protein